MCVSSLRFNVFSSFVVKKFTFQLNDSDAVTDSITHVLLLTLSEMSAENERPVCTRLAHMSVVRTFATVILYLEQASLYFCGPSRSVLPPLALEFGLPCLRKQI